MASAMLILIHLSAVTRNVSQHVEAETKWPVFYRQHISKYISLNENV